MTPLSKWDDIPQTDDDLRRKFNGSYVLGVVNKQHSKPQTLSLSTPDGRLWEVSFIDEKKGKISTLIEVRSSHILVKDAIPSQTGVVQYDKDILYFSRICARQWQVGLTRANGQILNSSRRVVSITLEPAAAVFQPQYLQESVSSFVKKLEDKKSGYQAIAISKLYWLKREGSEDITLYRNLLPIGTFSYGGFMINKSCRDFTQELQDDLKIQVR